MNPLNLKNIALPQFLNLLLLPLALCCSQNVRQPSPLIENDTPETLLGPVWQVSDATSISRWSLNTNPKQKVAFQYFDENSNWQTLETGQVAQDAIYEVFEAIQKPALYRYRVDETPSRTFQLKAINFNKKFTLVAWGDSQYGVEVFKSQMVPLMEKLNPDALLGLGDMVQGKPHDPTIWQKQLYGPLKNILSEIPFYPVMGNHDKENNHHKKYFFFANNETWYVREMGPMMLLVLNTEESFRPGTAQRKWFDMLAQSSLWRNAKFRVAAFHRPPIPFRWHVPHYAHGAELIEPIAKTLSLAGVDLMLNGHEHNYVRQRMAAPGKEVSMHNIISGGGGGRLDDKEVVNISKRLKEEYAVTVDHANPVHHLLHIEVSEKQLKVTAIKGEEGGRAFDQLVITPQEMLNSLNEKP